MTTAQPLTCSPTPATPSARQSIAPKLIGQESVKVDSRRLCDAIIRFDDGNKCSPRASLADRIIGISQFSYAAEAAFAVGPFAVMINFDAGKAAGSGNRRRPTIWKRNGAQVPAYTFLDLAFKALSAIWSTDVDEAWVIGKMRDLEVMPPEGPEPPTNGVQNRWHFGGRSPPRHVVFDEFQCRSLCAKLLFY